MNKLTTIGFFALISLVLGACGVQEGDKDDKVSPPDHCMTCGHEDAGTPMADAGDKPATDSGSPNTDAGHPATDAGNVDMTPPDTTDCSVDSDCASDKECLDGFCIPKGIVPPSKPSTDAGSPTTDAGTPSTDAGNPASTPECSKDSDCNATCACMSGSCIKKPDPKDTTGPKITNVSVVNNPTTDVTKASVTVTFTTDEPATADLVEFLLVVDNTQVQLGYAVDRASFSTTHTVTLKTLVPGTDYVFHVSCEDASGNGSVTSNAAFKTAYLGGPFRANGANKLEVNSLWINGSECGRMKGQFSGLNWDLASTSGSISDTNGDGWLEYDASVASAGVKYIFNYADATCGSSLPSTGYARWSDVRLLKAMSPASLRFVECSWFDNHTGNQIVPADISGPNGTPDGVITDADYECHGAAIRNADGTISGAGLEQPIHPN